MTSAERSDCLVEFRHTRSCSNIVLYIFNDQITNKKKLEPNSVKVSRTKACISRASF